MLETPQVIQTEERLTAVIRIIVPREEITLVVSPGLNDLVETITGQGVSPVGTWFTHHLQFSEAVFDFELGLPVSAPVKSQGRVKPSVWPAMKVARAIFRGSYEALGAAWDEFDEWIETQGHTAAADLWEVYLCGPEATADQNKWRTQLNRQLV